MSKSYFVFFISSVENKGVNSTRLVACITTLYLFSKIRAQLMVKHAMTMQPYLTTKCNVSGIHLMNLIRSCHNCVCVFMCFWVFVHLFHLSCNHFSDWSSFRAYPVISVILSSLQTANDFMVICNVAKILELVVPLMEHPSETILATIEEDLMKLIIKYGMTVSGSGFLDTSIAHTTAVPGLLCEM